MQSQKRAKTHKNRPSWASQYQSKVGQTRIERGLGGPVSNLNGLGGPVLSQTRNHDSHERSTKGRWANQYLSACSARLPTSACSALCLLGTSYSACSARPTVPARHILQCLLGTSTYQCLLGTPKCLLGAAHPPAPAPDPRSASPGCSTSHARQPDRE